MTLQIIFTYGGMILAAAAAIYWSMPERPSIQRNGQAQRQNPRRLPNQNNQRYRRSEPGDRCLFCHRVMTNDGMTRMRCGHALCNECYLTCSIIRTTCPYCDMAVFRI